MESQPMLTQREKSPLLEKFFPEEDGTHDAVSWRTVSSTHYQQAIPAPLVELNTDGPGPWWAKGEPVVFSAALSFRWSVQWWSGQCPQKGPDASHWLCFPSLSARRDICLACLCVCLITPESGIPRTVDPQSCLHLKMTRGCTFCRRFSETVIKIKCCYLFRCLTVKQGFRVICSSGMM